MDRPDVEAHTPDLNERQRLRIAGVVQGVGFRPFIFGLARQLGLTGFVGNSSAGVFIEIEGPTAQLAEFRQRITADAPPLAHVEHVTAETIAVCGDEDFSIIASRAKRQEHTLISPDLVTCDSCLAELADPEDRRYRYPFINCTNCGPRFTIIRDIPYDRPLTTMAGFEMCAECQAEYDDPGNRRFHAQPNACPVCGPQVEFVWSSQSQLDDALRAADPIEQALEVILRSGIVAVKGIGGFHLACDATSDHAVQTLRRRKGRVDKPFAVMAPDLETLARFAEVTPREAALLTSKERPIVLLRKKEGSALSEFVAPGNPFIGVMLPYTPLHYLLFTSIKFADVSVMTSGNLANEPIVKDNDQAMERLSGLADAFLLHNRDIFAHCDDSVVRVFEGQEMPIRRSRGYAPFPVKLPFSVPPILAIGGELKNTFCLTKDNYAFMSQHIGDMENLETLQAFDESAANFSKLFRMAPTIIAADMHPGYLSSQWASQPARTEQVVRVQHHHAHIAAVMAEHGLDGQSPVIGFSFDGTGYGPDGAIWGGEMLLADYNQFKRLAHLKYVPLPGGDAAVKRPYRIALAHLWAAGIPWTESLAPVAASTEEERRIIRRQLETGLNAVSTSSMGRLFDAVASLLGLRQTITYEAQAAIELEATAVQEDQPGYSFRLLPPTADAIEIDSAPVLHAIVADLRNQVAPTKISTRFHIAVADLILQLSLQSREIEELHTVALSGGVFQNVRLLTMTVQRLRAARFAVLTHRLVPPNDGGLALGQAVICSRQLVDRAKEE